MGIAGTETLFPIGVEKLYPTETVVRAGRPFLATTLMERADHDRQLAMDVVGLVLASLVPSEYRGEYGDDAAGLDPARRLLRALYD